MQFQLPLFPIDIKMVNDIVGFREQDGFVYYLHSGNLIYCHKKEDRNSYRHTMASLVVNHLCTIGELSRALGVNRKNIERYVKTYHEHGPGYFFNRPDGRGQCHKLTEDLRATIQEKLDAGLSQYRIAREHGISDSAIAYHINKGTLKKRETGNPSR